MAFFTEHVGIRGDVRYFRTLTDEIRKAASMISTSIWAI